MTIISDEEIARRLQQQYRREANNIMRIMRPPTASAPPISSTRGTNSTNHSNHGVSKSNRTPTKKKNRNNNIKSTPDTIASNTPSPQKKKHTSTPRTSSSSTPRSSPRSSPSNGMFIPADTKYDEKVARKLDQELRDAELATSLVKSQLLQQHNLVSTDFITLPQDKTTSQTKGRSSTPSKRSPPPPSYNDCRGKALHYATRIIIAIIVLCVVFILYITLFSGKGADPLDPASWLPGYPESDPSLGSVGDNNLWKPLSTQDPNTGLSLQVLNNLQAGSDWHDYLKSSIFEWDSGTPDAVTLNIRSMTWDPECRAVRRAMKVCNANYGPTDWRGVNQILLQDEYIITSLAKMNDYYLEGTNRAQKQYTMCHELGHGLGLGHTDENFHNKDLGNCMDYTERPENNMHPDTLNFEALEQMYGNVNENVKVERLGNVATGGDRRIEDREEGERIMLDDEEFEMFAAYLLDPIVTSSTMNEDGNDGQHISGSRLLHGTDKMEHHVRQLGNGYSIRTSILLA